MNRLLIRTSLLLAALAAGASANVVTLPTGNFSCTFEAAPLYNFASLANCPGDAAASAMTPPASGVQGVSFGYSTPITWNVDSNSPETEIATLTMSSGGGGLLTGGSGTAAVQLPLHYDFTIAEPTAFTCSSSPCEPNLTWTLMMTITGAAVANSDGIRLQIATGSGTGEFSGTVVVPQPSVGQVQSLSSYDITAGLPVTVTAALKLNAYYLDNSGTQLPSGDSGTYTVLVPAGASFDVESADSIPEPGTLSMIPAAGLILAAARKLRNRQGRRPTESSPR